VEGYNANSIGIAYVGGLDRATKPKDTRTEKQRTSLQKLLKDLKARYPKAIIMGHRDLSKDLNKDGIITPNEWMKACPCFNAKTEYKTL
jgi:N-acetylmuramoyl-L-alanine amidase